MNDHPHFILAHRLWDALASGDGPGLRRLLADKSVWRMPGASPLAGSYVGGDAIVEFMARIGDLTDDLRSDLLDIFVNDRGAVVRYALQAYRGPQQLDTEHLFMIHIERGEITGGVFAPLDQLAYDRFFSPH
jgi:ketosteroid isomerase-like protein